MFVELPRGTVFDPGALLETEAKLYQVVAFDPGGTTGWAVFGIHEVAMYSPDYRILDNVEFWSAGEFGGPLPKVADDMVELVEAWEEAEVVAEDFHLRHMSADLSPVRLNFALELALRPRVLYYQQPSLAMTAITDARLKDIGYWERLAGQPHARDGVRHALTFARRRKKELEALARLQHGKAPAG